MQYGVKHNVGGPRSPGATSVQMASHLVARVRRPSRFRNRTLMIYLVALGTLLLFLGHRNYQELEETASALKTYIPNKITDVIAQYGLSSEFQDTRWDDDAKHIEKIAYKKPKFHLLIPASNHTANLCKTLLSAAILNYPPPTLVSYGHAAQNETSGLELVKNTHKFLLSREARDDDLVLVVEEDAWFQLPAAVTINRFFQGMQYSSAELLKKYGDVPVLSSDIPTTSLPKFTSKVLFGATKECSNAQNDPACFSAPQSPLPKDIYGPETDKYPDGRFNRPRFMGSSMVMGRVSDLRPIYKHAIEMLESGEGKTRSSQHIFSRIYGEQEYVRSLSPVVTPMSRSAKFRNLFSGNKAANAAVNFTVQPNKNYEFSITLDYYSSIFQIMNNSAGDVHFVSFNHPSVIVSPSKISANAFANPIHLPLDLNSTSPPFSQHIVSSARPDPPITALDDMPGSENTNDWKEIELAINVVVPGSSVPASLNFEGNENLLNEMWGQMWYHKYARALMRQYVRSPDGPIAAEAARTGGDKWWDLRGGKGGVWTDRGEWLEWNEVCGGFDSEVFGDGKGEFGYEDEDIGGQKVEYKFGNVVSGRVGKGKEKDKDAVEDDEEGGEENDVDSSDVVNENSEGENEDEEKTVPETEEQKIAKATDKFIAELEKEDSDAEAGGSENGNANKKDGADIEAEAEGSKSKGEGEKQKEKNPDPKPEPNGSSGSDKEKETNDPDAKAKENKTGNEIEKEKENADPKAKGNKSETKKEKGDADVGAEVEGDKTGSEKEKENPNDKAKESESKKENQNEESNKTPPNHGKSQDSLVTAEAEPEVAANPETKDPPSKHKPGEKPDAKAKDESQSPEEIVDTSDGTEIDDGDDAQDIIEYEKMELEEEEGDI